MTTRWSRHNIRGSEAGDPRPIAYLRAGRTRRLNRRGRSWALWLLLLFVLALVFVGFAITG